MNKRGSDGAGGDEEQATPDAGATSAGADGAEDDAEGGRGKRKGRRMRGRGAQEEDEAAIPGAEQVATAPPSEAEEGADAWGGRKRRGGKRRGGAFRNRLRRRSPHRHSAPFHRTSSPSLAPSPPLPTPCMHRWQHASSHRHPSASSPQTPPLRGRRRKLGEHDDVEQPAQQAAPGWQI